MNKEELKTKLEEVGLSRVSEQLISLAKMSIRFTTEKSSDDVIPVGASKIGGFPDLPNNHPYPKWKNVPLSFLAQINLSDISIFSTASVLPSSGVLSFFYSATQETWGFDPKDKGSWQIYYFADMTNLQRTEIPNDIPEEGYYSSCSLFFFEELTLLPWESIVFENLYLTKEERDIYIDLLDQIYSNGNDLINRILGYPDQIQGDMQLECQLASNGLYCGDGTGYEDPRRKELEPDSVNWQLLFQLDSEEENAGMCWGDVGRVYFWIYQKELINKDFDKTWMILQCT